ncbi:hypothetical protein [Oryzihumus sp.]|uniref:hypothetical protein n=1 Tax=Oryzihumus sp. TaxID=1968903 RepID=UPI002EDB5EE6
MAEEGMPRRAEVLGIAGRFAVAMAGVAVGWYLTGEVFIAVTTLTPGWLVGLATCLAAWLLRRRPWLNALALGLAIGSTLVCTMMTALSYVSAELG